MDLTAATNRALVWSAAVAMTLSAFVLPDDLLGAITYEVHILALLPFAGVAYLAAAQRRELRLFAAPASLVLAEFLSWATSSAMGEPWLFSLGSVVIILVFWAPWPPILGPAEQRRLLLLAAFLPAAVLLAAFGTSTAGELPSLLSGRLSATGNANELAWTAVLGMTGSLLLWQRSGEAAVRRGAYGRGIWWSLGLLNTVVLGLTGSRMAGAFALSMLAWVGWTSWKSGGGQPLDILGHTIALAVLWLPRAIGRSFAGREEEEILGVDGSGRLGIWRAYFEDGLQYFATGGGIGRTHRISLANPEVIPGQPPHNELLWLLISVGVAGAVIVALGWYVTLRRRAEWLSRGSPVFPLVVGLPVLALVDNAFTAVPLTMPLMIMTAVAARGAGEARVRLDAKDDRTW